ncbi:MAG: exodeoxyribonuclease VII small subunit [bacterium]|nr:exodeoxyribonuclease VII small subunit [bacterium]
MSNKINDKIAQIDKILLEIESGEVSIEEISDKYKNAINLVNEVESDLDNISNEIEIVSKDFSQD